MASHRREMSLGWCVVPGQLFRGRTLAPKRAIDALRRAIASGAVAGQEWDTIDGQPLAVQLCRWSDATGLPGTANSEGTCCHT